MSQTDRTLQEATTSLSPSEVLSSAKRFFTGRNGIYTAFLDMEGPSFVTLRGQGGEEIAIGVSFQNGATRVTGSTYLFDSQLARFLATLPTPSHAAAQDAVKELSHSAELLA
jgi:hypothetical protein